LYTRKPYRKRLLKPKKVKKELASLAGYSARNAFLKDAFTEIGNMPQPPEIITNTV
jgi:hypothetical protein